MSGGEGCGCDWCVGFDQGKLFAVQTESSRKLGYAIGACSQLLSREELEEKVRVLIIIAYEGGSRRCTDSLPRR